MNFFLSSTLRTLIFILLVSCQNNENIEPSLSPNISKSYKISVSQILFENKAQIEDLIKLSLESKIKNIFNERKFFPASNKNLMKILLDKATITNEADISNKNYIYTLALSLKIEIYREEDPIFPAIETNYSISESRSLLVNSSFNQRIKLIDRLIDTSIEKLNNKIDENFEQYFSSIIVY